MGYTHYVYRPEHLDHAKFDALCQDVRDIVNASEIPIFGALGEGEPEYGGSEYGDSARIALNGDARDDRSHETFVVRLNMKKQDYIDGDRAFEFCKTARKPYDVVVVASLIAMQDQFGDAVEISSDGMPEDWQDGLRLFERATGRKGVIPPEVMASEVEV